ncbi:hypothetical protein CTEN210_08011 [Chaetoceros tenuissimus]|uniref:HTH OST-type domain-containing protein n=1 Tax=Chaetoceros tenuissimus TaxID=426638 RepID=A0AAD3CUZ4_9STRA|nr:hypothetical protein CTEN210_08011 [Chaetoceros tenuissimus]
MTSEVERNIKSLICENSGELSLSTIKDLYLFRFGSTLVVPPYVKLSSWIDSFPSFYLKKKRGTNDTIVYLKEGLATSHGVNHDEVENIKQLFSSKGGELSMSWLKEDYMKKFHEPLRVSGRLSSWLKNVPCFGMKVRPNTNDSVLYLKQPVSILAERLQDINTANEEVAGGHSDVFSDHEESEPEETKIDEIIESLLAHAGGSFQIPNVHQEVQSILNILPSRWTEALKSIGVDKVTDISLDVDRRPHCWIDGKRLYIAQEGEKVNVRDIDFIVQHLKEIGSDNRAGLDKQLHRVSAIRNNNDAIIGLTIRIGRHVEGNADFLLDLLYDKCGSILLLGEVS